jgi:hypothetical protein
LFEVALLVEGAERGKVLLNGFAVEIIAESLLVERKLADATAEHTIGKFLHLILSVG